MSSPLRTNAPAAAAERRVALVTGANSGIGFEAAKELASQGFHVVLACRRSDAAEQAATRIREATPDALVSTLELDLASQPSVRAAAAAYAAAPHGRKLHVLINNAGNNFWGLPPRYTADGIGACAQVNFLGPFTLTRLLLPQLLAAAPSRVVTVSSVMHRSGTLKPRGAPAFLRRYDAGTYSHAKLAEVLFTYELDRRTAARGVRAVAVDPGAVQTNIWQGTPFARAPVKAVMDRLYAPPREGAVVLVHAATAPLPDGLLYFARGLFAAAPVTADSVLPKPLWLLMTGLSSVLDQPLRGLSRGALAATVAAVASSPESYERARAEELWDEASRAAELPADAFAAGAKE